MLEKITNPARSRQWAGSIPVEYVYTPGVAGEAFLRVLKDRGRLLTSRCRECDITYLPARLYCERCLEETEDYQEVEPRGVVHAYTGAHRDLDGEPLHPPQYYAFIRMPHTNGGMVHRLGKVKPDEVFIGLEVEAVLLPPEQRTGSINDIAYFQPVE